MGVPGGIEQGGHGADDEGFWHERYKGLSGALQEMVRPFRTMLTANAR